MRRTWFGGACGVGLLLGLAAGCASPPRAAHPLAPARDRVKAETFKTQALASIEQGRFEDAERTLLQAQSFDPFDGEIQNNLGVVLLRLGRWYEAGHALQGAIRLMPRASQPRVNLALLYEKVGQFAQAEEQLQEALRSTPEEVEIVGQLARLHVRQNKITPQTVALLETVAAQDNDPAWREWAKRCLVMKGRVGSELGAGP